MTGEGCLHRNRGGFEIANFSDHDDVRILAQNSAQAACECHFNACVNLRLADAIEVVFDGIFNGEYVATFVVQACQAGIQGGGFTGATG